MARPEEIKEAALKTFRLPARLIEQLENATEVRDENVSFIVREILGGQIKQYFEQWLEKKRQSLQKSIAEVESDEELQKVFSENMDKNPYVVPEEVMLDLRRNHKLIEALKAHKKIQALEATFKNLFPSEGDQSRELLEELIGSESRSSISKKLKKLVPGVEGREFSLSKNVRGDFFFTLSPILAREIYEWKKLDPSVIKILEARGTAGILGKLIEHGFLEPIGQSNEIQIEFRWVGRRER